MIFLLHFRVNYLNLMESFYTYFGNDALVIPVGFLIMVCYNRFWQCRFAIISFLAVGFFFMVFIMFVHEGCKINMNL